MGKFSPGRMMMEQGKERLARMFRAEKERFERFVRRKLGVFSRLDAEDIVSEVVYRLLRRADVMGEIEHLTAYMYRSLENRIVDHRRKALKEVSPEGEAGFVSGEGNAPDQGRTPEEDLALHDLRVRLAQAIGKLSPQERAVFLATEMDGRSFRDLALEWDEPIGTLLSRKSRAAARLREMLADCGDPA